MYELAVILTPLACIFRLVGMACDGRVDRECKHIERIAFHVPCPGRENRKLYGSLSDEDSKMQ